MEKSNRRLDWSKSFMYNIHQTHFLVEKHLEGKLGAAKGISFSQFLIILAINCKERSSQTNIAEFLYLTEATVSRHINALAKAGYVTRKDDPDNRRKHILALTAKGTRAFTSAHSIIERELTNIFEVIPTKDRAQITNAFDNVLKKLGAIKK